jgi:adenylate cyclase
MRFLLFFTRIKNSFLTVILLIQLLMITLAVFMTRLTIDILDQTQAEKHKVMVSTIYNQLEKATDGPRAALSAIAHNDTVLRAFASGNREELTKVLTPLWRDLKELGYQQLQFEVPQANSFTVFLRMHHLEEFGDDASNRPMVMKANVQKQTLAGLEQGRSGYGFRAITPLFYQGRYIGSVELGSNFGEDFLRKLSGDYPGGYALLNLSRGMRALDDHVVFASLGKDADGDFQNLPPPDEVFSVVKRGEPFFFRSRQTNSSTFYIPIKNFQGDIAVVLKYVYPTSYYSRINNIIWTAGIICLVALVLSVGILLTLHRLISDPLKKLVKEAENIRNFRLDEAVEVTSSLTEMNNLIEATRNMKAGLQSFRKYVPAELVRQLIATGQVAIVGGQRRQITVLFADIADFTTISESLSPNELTAQLSEYLSAMTDVILSHKGTVDKYIGDSIMAFWGAPVDVPNHAELAALAALECQRRCLELNRKWEAEGKKPFKTRIGLNSGEIIVGNMGSTERLNYTIIGDDVNVASRLEGLNKTYSTGILLSQNTKDLLPDNFALRQLDFVLVKGKTKTVVIYELVARKEDVTTFDLDFLKGYNEAVRRYRERRWDEAQQLFEELLIDRPGDVASQLLIERIKVFRTFPPPERWRGEFAAKAA